MLQRARIQKDSATTPESDSGDHLSTADRGITPQSLHGGSDLRFHLTVELPPDDGLIGTNPDDGEVRSQVAELCRRIAAGEKKAKLDKKYGVSLQTIYLAVR